MHKNIQILQVSYFIKLLVNVVTIIPSFYRFLGFLGGGSTYFFANKFRATQV
jgi:hypothetical protein